MAAQLDLSIASVIKDPELRASIERLGSAMGEAPPEAKRGITSKIRG